MDQSIFEWAKHVFQKTNRTINDESQIRQDTAFVPKIDKNRVSFFYYLLPEIVTRSQIQTGIFVLKKPDFQINI